MASYFDLMDTYNSYAGTDIVVTAQLAYENNESLKSKCYVLGSLQTISISTHQDKRPVRAIGNINAIDYVMGQRTIAGSLVFAVFDRHFADEMFDDLKTYTKSAVLLADEIPPLNMTISFANEYGKKSKMILYGVKIINEGQVMSINDLYTENTYQFVALGMEPLKSEESIYNSIKEDPNKNDKTYDKNNMPFEYEDNEYTYKKTPHDYFVRDSLPSKIDKNNYDIHKNIELNYEINQPITKDGNGILLFHHDNDTNIFVTNKETNIVVNVNDHTDNNLYIELPQGEYNVQYIDKDNNKKSKIYDIFISFDTDYYERNDHPIVAYITDCTIDVESNNPSHDTLVLKNDTEPDNEIIEFPLNKNKCILNNLKPNTNYEIFTTNKTTTSKPLSVTTMPTENYDITTFIDYVKNNKKMLIANFIDFDFNALYNSGYTLVDKILLLPDSKNKTELILYGTKFQNDFINSINSSKSIKIINKNILNIEIEKTSNLRLNMYKSKNNKEYFCQTFKDVSNLTLSGDLGKKHILQGINNFNNLKTLKYSFAFFNSIDKEMLKPYSDLYNLNRIDLEKYALKYSTYNKSFLQAIAAKDKNAPNSYILEEPATHYSNGLLTIDLNYAEYLQDEEYYLCISSIYDVLDYTPANKIMFKRDTELLALSNFEALIYEDNYYLVWIEDKYYNKISTSSILSTYSNKNDLNKYNKVAIKERLDLFFNILNNIHTEKSLFDTIHLSLLSYGIPIKDLNLYIEHEIINQVYNSLSSIKTDEILMTAIKLNYSNIKNICDKVIIKNDKLEFINPTHCHMVSIDYFLDEDKPIKSFHNEYELQLSGKYSHYTLVYLVEKSMFNRSGFVLINNSNKNIYNFNIEMEVL